MLQHLEAEQTFSQKIKSNLHDPFMANIAQSKQHKEIVDRQMNPLVTKIMNGRRKLASDKKTFLQLLDEYKVCMYDIDLNPAQQKKAPNLRKKLSECAAKYERTVKEVISVWLICWIRVCLFDCCYLLLLLFYVRNVCLSS